MKLFTNENKLTWHGIFTIAVEIDQEVSRLPFPSE